MHFSSSNSRGNGNFNNFSSFASINFNLSKSKLSDLVTWEPKLQLKQPLLNLHPSLIIEALNANRLIVHFMESDATSEQISASEIPNLDVERVSSLVKLGCQVSSEEIKDEIYCQLMKQTTRNFNRTSCLRGYQLILSCLAGFAPSQKLEPLLQYHLQVGCLGGALLSRRIVRLAESCIRALKMIKILGSRTWGLTRSEIITIISESNGLSIKVWFSKSQTIDIMVDSWTTVKELTAAVCDKLGIDCSSIMTLCLTSTSSDGQFEANSASCRGVLNTAFNHLHRHYVKLKPRASDLVIKWQLDSPFGRRKGTETLNLSARVERALDSCLQVHVLGQLEIPRGFYLNTSEHGTEQIHAARRMPKFDLRLCLSSTFHLMKRTKKPSIPFKAADEVVLKMQLVIWIFPQRGFYESSKTEMKTSMTDHCKLIQRDYEEVKVYHDKWAEKPIAIFDETSTRLFYECHIAEGEASMRNRICWPSNGAARKVLYAQLTDVTADRRQVPVEDIEILRMTALILAEHQVTTCPIGCIRFYAYYYCLNF